MQAKALCCDNPLCAGLLWDAAARSGDFHADLDCGYAPSTTYRCAVGGICQQGP